jgi:hypothetical protein
MGFTKSRRLKCGIMQSWESIKNSSTSYNPLKHLNQAKENQVDLKDFFPMN